MMTTASAIVAFQGAGEEMIAKAARHLQQIFDELKKDEPSLTVCPLIYFISGGSEQQAIMLLRHGTLNLLVAGSGNNAWAAATEVKAYAMQHGFQAQLIAEYAPDFKQQLVQWMKVKTAFDRLSGQRLGLLGNVSDWLVASAPEEALLRQRFGIELIGLPLDAMPDYLHSTHDPQFQQCFAHNTIQPEVLASVSGFLKQAVADHRLDALTLQCFRLVKEKGVTACLPIALMNFNGIPGGCEGDLVSIAGIMLLKELTGHIAWMANMVKVETDKILLAHCTVPLQYAKKTTINSHFETQLSAAVEADLNFDTVTLFRMNQQLDQVFIATGKVVGTPKNPDACRTQIEVALPPQICKQLIDRPLGNHHLIIPGDHRDLISKAIATKGFEVIV